MLKVDQNNDSNGFEIIEEMINENEIDESDSLINIEGDKDKKDNIELKLLE